MFSIDSDLQFIFDENPKTITKKKKKNKEKPIIMANWNEKLVESTQSDKVCIEQWMCVSGAVILWYGKL